MMLLNRLILFFCAFNTLEALKFNESFHGVLPSKYECGQQESDNYHDDTNNGTRVDEFPWLVYIPLKSRMYNPQENLQCAGSLISKRYVLISKSCLQFVLTKVHFGQYDVAKNVTCNHCGDVLTMDFEKKIPNDDLDVALLKLKEDIDFSDYIRPICLPFDDFPRAKSGDTVYTSGWGPESVQDTTSNTKKKVKQVISYESDECRKSNKHQFVPSKNLICVKVQTDSSNAPCYGDEGSPIMYSSDGHWIVEGILTRISYSDSSICATNNPSVGTKITDEMLQWIINQIHE